ncbi:hypothetical protein [Adhaeribacter pallidiroseus]|uniref:Lipoprotein n=1 Tax=Adhaeribacter pallidiroseus TaxID=2072847 RepID=A0A369QMD0_9BACT|nr:hypothetical protein [Adhaeribacter pallidiroseus]RDC64239.1 hypothetical protein AHMF7616_02851 [Adhaeribacter pallidiroseus]RDC64825.1 hypothetical protein AHMF7616_03445 [Adhaeribacter pallidiroseus]
MKRKLVKQAVIFVLAFAIISCTDPKSHKVRETAPAVPTTVQKQVEKEPVIITEEREPAETPNVSKLELETFTSYPDEFSGCGCSLFLTEQDKQEQKYIYLDAGDIAMIKLNEEVHTFEYKGKVKGNTLYTSNSMQIEVNITKTVENTEMEETSDVEGTFTVTKGNEKLVQKFIGYCGC